MNQGHAKHPTSEYPQSVSLRDGRTLALRLMQPADAAALHAFFCAIPEEDLLFLRRDVTERAEIDAWAAGLAEGRIITLLAEDGGRIAGEASLHRSSVPWSAHVGEIRVVIDAAHRRQGLGEALIQAIFLVALGEGVEKIVAEMTPDQTGAINVFQKLGFHAEGLLRAQVRDRRGTLRDLIVMAQGVAEEGDLLAQFGVDEAVSADE